jgi:hypothetical protein
VKADRGAHEFEGKHPHMREDGSFDHVCRFLVFWDDSDDAGWYWKEDPDGPFGGQEFVMIEGPFATSAEAYDAAVMQDAEHKVISD